MSHKAQAKQLLEIIIEYNSRPTNKIGCIKKDNCTAVSITASIREKHTFSTINDKSSYVNMFNVVQNGSLHTSNFITQSFNNLRNKYSQYHIEVYSSDKQLISMLKSKKTKNVGFNIIDFSSDRTRAAVSHRVNKQADHNFDNIVATPVKKKMKIKKRSDESPSHILSPFHESKKRFDQRIHVATDASVRDRYSSSVCVTEEMEVFVSEDHKLLKTNIAELEAIWLAVRKLASPSRHLIIHSDSKCAIDMLYNRKNLKSKKSKKIVDDIYEMVNIDFIVSVTYVKGHSGNYLNSAADYAARCSRMLASGEINKEQFDQKIDVVRNIINSHDVIFSVPKKVTS